MDERLKQRLTGAIVLIALGVIFIPMVLDGPDEAAHKVKVELPPKPEYAFQSRVVPLPPKAPPASLAGPAVAGPVARGLPDAPLVTEPGASPKSAAVAPPAPLPPAPAPATPPPSVAPAPIKPAVPDAGRASAPKTPVAAWVVQVGSFSNEGNANKLRVELRKAGFAAYVESEGEGASKAYKVRIGPETERSSVEALKTRLERERKLTAQVRPYP